MKHFKISYKWFELKVFQANYAFVTAESAEQAEQKFTANWLSNNTFEIISIEKVGI